MFSRTIAAGIIDLFLVCAGTATEASAAAFCSASSLSSSRTVAVSVRSLSPFDLRARDKSNRAHPEGPPAVGKLRYEWAFELQSKDPLFSNFIEFSGPRALIKTACGQILSYDLEWGRAGIPSRLKNFTAAPLATGADPFKIPGFPVAGADEQVKAPSIPGYRLAGRVAVGGRWGSIGLWQRTGAKGTLIAAFGGPGSGAGAYTELARLSVRFDLISALPAIDADYVEIDLLSSPSNDGLARLLQLSI